MKLIKIEEIKRKNSISQTANTTNTNGKSTIHSHTKDKYEEEKTKVLVNEKSKSSPKSKINLFPFGKKGSFIIGVILIISCFSIAYLCTGYDYGHWLKWEDFYLNLFITFIIECALYGIAVWRKSNIMKFVNTFKPQFGKGYNRLIIVLFTLLPWIIGLICCFIEGLEEFFSTLLIVYAVESILYISILWVYNGFEEERKENKKKENINNNTNEL